MSIASFIPEQCSARWWHHHEKTCPLFQKIFSHRWGLPSLLERLMTIRLEVGINRGRPWRQSRVSLWWSCVEHGSARLNGGMLSVLAVQMADELYHHVFGVINVAPLLYSKRLATIGLTGTRWLYSLLWSYWEKNCEEKWNVHQRTWLLHARWLDGPSSPTVTLSCFNKEK